MESRLADGAPALRQGAEPIAGYRLVRRRGRGGFGEVWEAEASGGIHVALKFVHGSPRARDAEFRALNFVRGIHHPNLLANFGAWEAGGILVVGMELADGSLWDRYIQAADDGLGGIPRAELLGYMADAAAGLDYLNDSRHTVDGRPGVGIQHRDVKPPNILLFGGGAKVADLGMARALEGGQAGHTGTWTFPYAAPEFFRGRTTRQSDQYGLGATYCQLRCGRLPYEGGAATVTAGHLYGRPDLEGLPEAERLIVERALAKEPGERWPDCRAFVEALRAIAPDQAPEVVSRPEEPVEDIPRMFRSSTGIGAFPPAGLGEFDDTPPPSWIDFEPGGDLASLMHTAETTPPAPSLSSLSTAILPEPDPEPFPSRLASKTGTGSGCTRPVPDPLSEAPFEARWADGGAQAPPMRRGASPHRPPQSGNETALEHGPTPLARRRTGPGGFGRLAATVLAVGLAVVVAGVGATNDEEMDAPPLDEPKATSGDPTVPPEATRPAVEIEPAPARAADEIRPGSTSPVEFDTTAEAPATRSDLVPARRPRPRPGSEEIRPAGASHPISPMLPSWEEVEPGPSGPSPAELARLEAAKAEAEGKAHLAGNALDRAIADFDRAIRLRPGVASTYFHRALARHRASHYPEALADYSEAIRLRPSDPFAFIARGQAHHDLGAYARAVADFDEAIRLRPGDPSGFYRRGMAHYRSDDYAGAVADFDEALRLDPKNHRAREFRDDALARLGGRVRDGRGLNVPERAAPPR
jgi:serine/threonine protein kinase/Flp pilus assembly protein TadD